MTMVRAGVFDFVYDTSRHFVSDDLLKKQDLHSFHNAARHFPAHDLTQRIISSVPGRPRPGA